MRFSSSAIISLIGLSAFPYSVSTKRATDFLPLTTLGNVGAAQTVSGLTTIVWQEQNGNISAIAVSGPSTTGITNETSARVVVPAVDALLGTPIVSVSSSSTPGTDFTDYHFFFLSPDHILSEARWSPSTFWIFGGNCSDCVTHSGFVVEGDSILYAMELESTGGVRVGIISPDAPNTVSEVNNLGGGWQIAGLPN